MQIRRATVVFAPHTLNKIPYLRKITLLIECRVRLDGERRQLEFLIKKLLYDEKDMRSVLLVEGEGLQFVPRVSALTYSL